jgi:hypothetical protein
LKGWHSCERWERWELSCPFDPIDVEEEEEDDDDPVVEFEEAAQQVSVGAGRSVARGSTEGLLRERERTSTPLETRISAVGKADGVGIHPGTLQEVAAGFGSVEAVAGWPSKFVRAMAGDVGLTPGDFIRRGRTSGGDPRLLVAAVSAAVMISMWSMQHGRRGYSTEFARVTEKEMGKMMGRYAKLHGGQGRTPIGKPSSVGRSGFGGVGGFHVDMSRVMRRKRKLRWGAMADGGFMPPGPR